VSVVRLRPAELIVQLVAERPGAVRKILHLAPATVVAHVDVELAVRAEAEHAAIVIAPLRLAGVLLERAQLDQVRFEGQRAVVPHEAIDPVAEHRDIAEHR
jgi:hypothetical protein